MSRWHVVTPEYPPQAGGVADYTALVAQALGARGERVSVHAPPALPDLFGPAALHHLDQVLDEEAAPARVLVQYVANVCGRRGANVPFARWIARRARRDDVRVMIHEPYLYWRWRPDHLAVAVAQRSMARTIGRSDAQLYLSTSAWRRYLQPFDRSRVAAARVLPIPSSIPHVVSPGQVGEIRERMLHADRRLVGHFGTYGNHIAPMVSAILRDLLSAFDQLHVLCLGRGAQTFVSRFAGAYPDVRDRIEAPNADHSEAVSLHLQACDVVVQPYPDGVTTRRTSVMAPLANACAVVTNAGALTEAVWSETGAVELVGAPDPRQLSDAVRRLLSDDVARTQLARQAKATYGQQFDLSVTVDTLLADTRALA